MPIVPLDYASKEERLRQSRDPACIGAFVLGCLFMVPVLPGIMSIILGWDAITPRRPMSTFNRILGLAGLTLGGVNLAMWTLVPLGAIVLR